MRLTDNKSCVIVFFLHFGGVHVWILENYSIKKNVRTHPWNVTYQCSRKKSMIPIKAHCWRKVFVAYAKMLQSPLHPFMRPRVRSKYWDHYSRSTQPRQTKMTLISWHRLLQSSSSCGQCHKVTCARWSEASCVVNKLWRHLYPSHISWSCEPLKVDSTTISTFCTFHIWF